MMLMSVFSDEIKKLENDISGTYAVKVGRVPVILVAAHGIEQKKRSGRIKLAEPYTRGIAQYVSKKTKCHCLVKNEDTGVDPNRRNNDEFKDILCDLIDSGQIGLLIDVHGAKRERDFDVEIGTANGELADPEVIERLIRCFKKRGIRKIAIDDPFNGGYITRTVRERTGINCVQIEINYKYRNLHNIRAMRRICGALAAFVKESC